MAASDGMKAFLNSAQLTGPQYSAQQAASFGGWQAKMLLAYL